MHNEIYASINPQIGAVVTIGATVPPIEIETVQEWETLEDGYAFLVAIKNNRLGVCKMRSGNKRRRLCTFVGK